MVAVSILLVVVALVALAAFGLLLVLARRVRGLEERVNLFLPASTSKLPQPGTPLAGFETADTAGRPISERDFAVGERILALLTTGCGECDTAAAAIREHSARLDPAPVVGVIGRPEERAIIVDRLAGHARVLEEAAFGPVSSALEINEFPAVLLIRDGHIQFADHALEPVLAHLSGVETGARR
jgi:hypothetical protein